MLIYYSINNSSEFNTVIKEACNVGQDGGGFARHPFRVPWNELIWNPVTGFSVCPRVIIIICRSRRSFEIHNLINMQFACVDGSKNACRPPLEPLPLSRVLGEEKKQAKTAVRSLRKGHKHRRALFRVALWL